MRLSDAVRAGVACMMFVAFAAGCGGSDGPGTGLLDVAGTDPGADTAATQDEAFADVGGRTDTAVADVPATGCGSDDDCLEDGACPAEAPMGCACGVDPMGGGVCLPKCNGDEDCSSVPTSGVPLTCGSAGVCVYGGGIGEDAIVGTDEGAADPGPTDPGPAATDDGPAADVSGLEPFSFFVTSLKAMQAKSGSQDGFGGDLRYGETGAGAGLRGADKICAAIAEDSMAGSSAKQWRAFLSATDDGYGNVVNAIDRIGEGPWYDRKGRVFAMKKADLLYDRPSSANATIINDFPNEDGVPNHQPILTQPAVDNHDFLTGSNAQGKLYSTTATCKDWTTSGATSANGKPRVGHSWPRSGPPGGGGGGGDDMANWMSALNEAGCGAGINLAETGGPIQGTYTVGSGGGYGGIYCFALVP